MVHLEYTESLEKLTVENKTWSIVNISNLDIFKSLYGIEHILVVIVISI